MLIFFVILHKKCILYFFVMLPLVMSNIVTAKSLILDLLRTSKPRALPVRLLIDTGAIFSISENALRVNLNRLIKRDVISQDSRGYYQVSEATSPLRLWVSKWRDGELRIRPWQQQWLTLQLSRDLKVKAMAHVRRAAYRFGFRQYWGDCWIRPDNLQTSSSELGRLLTQLSGENNFMLMSVSHFESEYDPRALWSAPHLEQNYRRQIALLTASLESIESADLEKKFRDSFILGGNCIHTLAIDPLLPLEMIDTELRSELTQLMKSYDRLCRPFWQQLFSQYKFEHSPAHLEPQLNQLLAIS